jgi:histone H3/H4
LTDRLAVLDDAVDAEVEDEGLETAPALQNDLPEMEEITGPLSDGYESFDGLSSVDLLTVSSDATGELRRAMFGENQGRISGVSGEDGSPPALSDGEPTFQFRYPDRRRSTLLPQPQSAAVSQDSIHGETAPELDYEDYETDASEDSPQIAITSTRKLIQPTDPISQAASKRSTTTKELRISKHGIEYPPLPTTLVKTLAQTFTRQYSGSSKLPKDALLAIHQASEWFFEQASEDLAAYATHAGRKTIDEADAVALMRRQRVLGGKGSQSQTLFSLAQRFLPRELLGEVRMRPKAVERKKGKGRKRKLQVIPEEEDDVTMM